MHETQADLDWLEQLLNRSYDAAGEHLALYGDRWREFSADPDIFYAVIEPARMFTFRMSE